MRALIDIDIFFGEYHHNILRTSFGQKLCIRRIQDSWFCFKLWETDKKISVNFFTNSSSLSSSQNESFVNTSKKTESSILNLSISALFYIPADTDVFRTSSGRLQKVTTSYDQTRRLHDIWQKTSDLQRLEEVQFTSSWRRPIYYILKTSVLRRLKNIWFTTSRRCRIYVVLKTTDLHRLEDVGFTSS